jgi:hypothetical protein
MTRPTVGGSIDYRRLAELHRPTDEQAIACEIRRLHQQGLTERDIGAALQVNPEAVRKALLADTSPSSTTPTRP